MTPDLAISTLQARYANGLTPAELIEEIHTRIQQVENPAIWIHLLSEEELKPYLDRLQSSETETLPLFGIPFAIKDNIDLAGVPTTAACPDYAFTPDRSSTVVEKLIQAGAIPIGKTNLDQFATGLVGVRTPYGVPRNPYAPDRVPGGSSCGSAVALSAGLVSFSLGTDTAGSGRIPAAFNKLWGVKPSKGRLSNRGLVPACKTLDCISIFALNAEDSALALTIAEGYDEEDAYSLPLVDLPVKGTGVLGIPKAENLMFFGDADYEASWLSALQDLKSSGWKLKEIDFRPFLQAARLLYEGPWVSERFTAVEEFLDQHPESFFPATLEIISGGADHSARDAFSAAYRLQELKRLSESVWPGIDAIVTPTAGGFPTLEDLENDPIGPNSQLGYYTNFMNLLDLCAVATPAGTTESDLPFGITWIAPRDQDQSLIEMAKQGPQKPSESKDTLSIILFGAHMEGLTLNEQVTELGAQKVGTVQTAPKYHMFHLAEPAPERPGLIRVEKGGFAIEGEEWSFPSSAIGAFLSKIKKPLGLGEVELSGGRRCYGFLCETVATREATDISATGGWRNFLAEKEKPGAI